MGGSKAGICRQLHSSLVVFMFIYIWHGFQMRSLMWSAISFFSVLLTTTGVAIVRLPKVKKFLVSMIMFLILANY